MYALPFQERIISISEARKNLADLIKSVAREGTPVSIAQDSHVEVSIVSRSQIADFISRLDALESVLETYEILADRSLMKKIKKSEKNVKKGKGYPLAESKSRMGL